MADTPVTSLDTLLQQALNPTAGGGFGAGIESTSIEDESIGGSEWDVYKIAKGKKDRLTFLTPNNIVHGRTHYVEGSGFLICMSSYTKQGDKEVMTKQAECCKRLDRSRKRCVGLALVYATDHNAKLQKVDPLFAMKVWRFNERTFALLRDLNAQFPLAQHDFIVSLDGEEKYQGCNLMPIAGDSVAKHPHFVGQYGKMVADWVAAMQPQMERMLGRRLDAAKWAEILKAAPAAGAAPAAPVTAEDGVQSLEDILSGQS